MDIIKKGEVNEIKAIINKYDVKAKDMLFLCAKYTENDDQY
jgi:hypothetical protein